MSPLSPLHVPYTYFPKLAYLKVISHTSWGRMLNIATSRSAMERWYINLQGRRKGQKEWALCFPRAQRASLRASRKLNHPICTVRCTRTVRKEVLVHGHKCTYYAHMLTNVGEGTMYHTSNENIALLNKHSKSSVTVL